MKKLLGMLIALISVSLALTSMVLAPESSITGYVTIEQTCGADPSVTSGHTGNEAHSDLRFHNSGGLTMIVGTSSVEETVTLTNTGSAYTDLTGEGLGVSGTDWSYPGGAAEHTKYGDTSPANVALPKTGVGEPGDLTDIPNGDSDTVFFKLDLPSGTRAGIDYTQVITFTIGDCYLPPE